MSRRSIKAPPPEELPFPIRGYAIINLTFYAFLALVYGAAYWQQKREVAGLLPVLAGLGVIFSLVSLYDATFDRVIFHEASGRKQDDADKTPDTAAGLAAGLTPGASNGTLSAGPVPDEPAPDAPRKGNARG